MLESRFVHDKGNIMPPASNRTQRKRPGDLTGVRGQALAQEAALNKQEAANQVADAREAERQYKMATEVDYSKPTHSVVHNEVEVDGEVVIEEVEVVSPTRRIRVNYPVQDMTFGREVHSAGQFDANGNMIKAPVLGSLRTFSFEEGRYYIVDADVADHLAFLGYIYE
jgi:hypothetical protein